MKIIKLSRISLSVFLALSLSASGLLAQPGGGGGEGGQGRGGGQGGQRGGGQNLQNLSEEERLARINKMIQQSVIKMAEAVEVREDQQEDFVKTFAKAEMQSLVIRSKMQQVGRDRAKRRAIMQEMQKHLRNTEKAMAKILDKEQMKKYKDAMQERLPQGRGGRGGPGGGGGGQGGGGGGQGRGGGGGGGGGR